jgi:hypothetical protein
MQTSMRVHISHLLPTTHSWFPINEPAPLKEAWFLGLYGKWISSRIYTTLIPYNHVQTLTKQNFLVMK